MNSTPTVIIVDPYSTGCLVAQEISRRGNEIICLWTKGFSEEMKQHVPMSCENLTYVYTLDEQDTLEETKQAVVDTGMNIIGCIAGGEAGVDFADALSEALGLRTNGTAIPNRRDKKVQQELIAAAGLRSVRQAGGTTLAEVDDFLKTEPYPIVLKPTESAGSDGVKLCHTYEEAVDHFHTLMRSQMVNGGECPAVLCQEFLRGKEYVVDHVSRDGVHKTTMVWVYDKRPANGAAFVYFGCDAVDSESEEAKILIPYVRQVLDALGLKNGASHGEVIITSDGPCLVEMNCRARGGDGNWRPLCRALTGGFSQVEGAADALLDEEAFNRYPERPPSPFKAAGQEVILVSYAKGKVRATPGYDMIRCLPSFVYLETGIKIGSEVDYTVDLVTGIGSVILMHEDPAVLEKDVNFIRYMEEIKGIFVFESVAVQLSRPRAESVALPSLSESGVAHYPFSASGPNLVRLMSNDRPELMGSMIRRMTTIDASREAVIVVDPYSTGCLIAEEIYKRGYKVIALWTDGFSEEMKKHIPLSCTSLVYHAEVTEATTGLGETQKLVLMAAGALRVVACLAGGEAGVDLADKLSERLQLRSNGTEIPNRRDKKIQQELIAASGLRSVRQAAGTTFAEVKHFLRTESYPVVLKPTESAGSDGVKLCHNFNEAKDHFDLLMRSQMVNGGQCPAVLCQEFLRGKEYVIDHVSRNGVHKTTMIWVYDKRPANGAAFVYYGCYAVDSESPEAKILIPYVRKVLDALGLKNGPSHGEVMMTPDGPCLVEMNCRARGGDGNWRPLARALTGGYSQVEAAVDSYLDGAAFAALRDIPPSPFKASGEEVILVSYTRGVVKSTPGFDIIRKLPSFVYLETGVKPGTKVDYTVDLVTSIGSVILMHRDDAILRQDADRVRQLEKDDMLFEYEDPLESLGHKKRDEHNQQCFFSASRIDLY
jgi:biotin carboxylase